MKIGKPFGLALLGCVFGLMIASCSPGSSSLDDAGTIESAFLEIMSPGQDIGLRFNDSTTLRVRYLDKNRAPIADGRVSFMLTGDASGATLSSSSALTNEQGIASVDLKAGWQEAMFHVQVTAEGAGFVNYTVAVSNSGFGSIRVGATIKGSTPIDLVREIRVLLYVEKPCAEIAFGDMESVWKDRTLVSVDETTLMEFIPLAVQYALVGVASDESGLPLAFGCMDIGTSQMKEGILLNTMIPLAALLPRPASDYEVSTDLRIDLSQSPHMNDGMVGWMDLGDCPMDPSQAILDCLIPALDNPGYDPDMIECNEPAAGPLAQALDAHRGRITINCRTSQDSQGRDSLEQVLTAAMEHLDEVDYLHGLAKDKGEMVGHLVLHSSLALTETSWTHQWTASHRLGSVEFTATPKAVALDLEQLPLPLLSSLYVTAAVQMADLPVLVLGRQDFTLSLPYLVLRALIQGYLGGTERMSVTDALEALLCRMALPDGWLEGEPYTACEIIDGHICQVMGEPQGCLGSSCNLALEALTHKLQEPFSLAVTAGTDFSFLAGQARLIDLQGDLEAEMLGSSSEPGIWDVAAVTSDSSDISLTTSFVGQEYTPVP